MEANSLKGLKGPFLSHGTDVALKPDFSGWATKAGLKCSDGLTIMTGAFKHQDQMTVPLVWQHGHNDPENVLGHAVLTHKDEGVWTDCFFNKTAKAVHARELLDHKDINQLSIWANDLIKRGMMVLHGAIREVSLVISGANPGALIESVTIRHGDGTEDEVEDEAIIYTGLTIEHSDGGDGGDGGAGNEDDTTVQEIIDTMDERQQEVLHYMIGEALQVGGSKELEQSNLKTRKIDPKGKEMKHNVFEEQDKGKQDPKHVLSHSDVQGIVADAMKNGSLKSAVENYALSHGIESIDVLFPEVRLLEQTPEFLSRRMEWVAGVLGGTRKSPFSRVKTVVADITFEEARAKGYIKGTMKKEEFFNVSKRITTPTTIYKKQKLDRDDIIDITDFDVITWMKGEMRLMLDEELARAILLGDGRDVDDPDKIIEQHIRPVLTDDDFYTVKVNIDLTTAGTKVESFIDEVIKTRGLYKGTGTPTLYTTLNWIAQLLLIRDGVGRRIYQSKADLVAALMVSDIIAVEVMESYPEVIGVLVNLNDYNIGADKGGEVNLFDFFDIDFNQQKYLIESRCSGALTRPRSAMVYRSAATTGDTAATSEGPSWDRTTFTVTIPVEANVNYVNAVTGDALADGDIVLAVGDVLTVRAVATAGHYLTNTKTEWSFMRPSS